MLREPFSIVSENDLQIIVSLLALKVGRTTDASVQRKAGLCLSGEFRP